MIGSIKPSLLTVIIDELIQKDREKGDSMERIDEKIL